MLSWFKKKMKHPTVDGIYSNHQGRIFTNGAQQVSFDFDKALPLFSPIGPATAVRRVLFITQPSQVWNPQSIPLSGIGGLQAGSLASQPLVNADFSPVE